MYISTSSYGRLLVGVLAFSELACARVPGHSHSHRHRRRLAPIVDDVVAVVSAAVEGPPNNAVVSVAPPPNDAVVGSSIVGAGTTTAIVAQITSTIADIVGPLPTVVTSVGTDVLGVPSTSVDLGFTYTIISTDSPASTVDATVPTSVDTAVPGVTSTSSIESASSVTSSTESTTPITLPTLTIEYNGTITTASEPASIATSAPFNTTSLALPTVSFIFLTDIILPPTTTSSTTSTTSSSTSSSITPSSSAVYSSTRIHMSHTSYQTSSRTFVYRPAPTATTIDGSVVASYSTDAAQSSGSINSHVGLDDPCYNSTCNNPDSQMNYNTTIKMGTGGGLYMNGAAGGRSVGMVTVAAGLFVVLGVVVVL